MITFFCWHCYGENPSPTGECRHCGAPVAAPDGASYVDKLLWALGHPLVERRMVAVRLLGLRRERRAVPALTRLIGDPDPFLAAAALESLVRICGVADLAQELERLADSGDAPIRRVAQRALSASAPGAEAQQNEAEE